MKTYLALAVLLLPGCAATGAPAALKGDVLGISGVLIGDSPKEVSSRLGAPDQQMQQSDFVTLIYRYGGFEVGFEGENAVDLRSTSPKACTGEGLCPGEPLEKMMRLYGKPEIAERETGRFFEYYTSDSFCWYQVAERGGNVTSVAVVCQP